MDIKYFHPALLNMYNSTMFIEVKLGDFSSPDLMVPRQQDKGQWVISITSPEWGEDRCDINIKIEWHRWALARFKGWVTDCFYKMLHIIKNRGHVVNRKWNIGACVDTHTLQCRPWVISALLQRGDANKEITTRFLLSLYTRVHFLRAGLFRLLKNVRKAT